MIKYESDSESEIEEMQNEEKFLSQKDLSNYLKIDECMASFQGRIVLKLYMKMKKKRKWGIKFFALTDSLSSYVYKLLPYTGKSFVYDKKLGIGPSVANQFCSLQLHQGVHLTFDSFFSSLQFIRNLELSKDFLHPHFG